MKLFKHLWLVTKHRYRVFIYCWRTGIPFRGFVHDLSKYSCREFLPSAKYYKGNQSPINGEREANECYSMVFNYHTGRNKHHWEFWINYYKGDILLKALPYKVCLEYVCDMIAASKTYNGRQFEEKMVSEYWLKRKDMYLIHSLTKKYIDWLFEQYEKFSFKGLSKDITLKNYLTMFKDCQQVERYKIELNKIS